MIDYSVVRTFLESDSIVPITNISFKKAISYRQILITQRNKLRNEIKIFNSSTMPFYPKYREIFKEHKNIHSQLRKLEIWLYDTYPDHMHYNHAKYIEHIQKKNNDQHA